MPEPFAPTAPQESDRHWMPILIGLVAVLVVIAAVVLLTRSKPKVVVQTDPYIAKLQLSDLKLSAAENYVGGTVTYLDVKISNIGDKTLEGAQMKAVFKNSLGEVVQTETLPLHVLTENKMGGYEDLIDLSRAPIGPGQTKTVRTTLEHLSADWNQQYPEMQLVDLKLKVTSRPDPWLLICPHAETQARHASLRQLNCQRVSCRAASCADARPADCRNGRQFPR